MNTLIAVAALAAGTYFFLVVIPWVAGGTEGTAHDGWGPDADLPVDLVLTDAGETVAELEAVLDEGAETWGWTA